MKPRGTSRVAALILAGGLYIGSVFPGVGLAQQVAAGDEFIYRAQARDTLIGLSRRLLREPARWVEVQTRNGIANPRRIPLGTQIRIPYAWLRMSVETAAVSNVAGAVLMDGKAVSQGAALPQGSLVQTGADGSVTLNLADGSVITLQKSSALRLETLQQVSGVNNAHDVRLKLESGRVQTVVRPHRDVGRFEIQTPVAVSAVRGTEFRTAFDADAANATDETLDGTVGVSGSTSEVPVPAGFGTRVERNGAPLPPVRLLPPPDLSTVADTNTTPQLNVQWPPVAGAVRYRVQVAPDPDFHTIVADADPAAPQATLAMPAEGNFWLHVRSIDQLGLEGPDATKAIRQHVLPPPPVLTLPRPGTRIAGAAASFTWSDMGTGLHYRWQMARDAQFNSLVMEREVDGATHVDVDGVEPGHYLWRVATIGAHGEVGEWSTPHDYVQRPSPPVLETPTIHRRMVELRWQASGATRFRVQVAGDADFTRPVIDRVVDAQQLSLPHLRAGDYYARVQIIDAEGGEDPFSSPQSFSVPIPLWFRIVVPIAGAVLIGLLA